MHMNMLLYCTHKMPNNMAELTGLGRHARPENIIPEWSLPSPLASSRCLDPCGWFLVTFPVEMIQGSSIEQSHTDRPRSMKS
ncbi:hypothetical protein EVAR_25935_1 [Eumeta japonica]|uniref:Uncharacterized protein n=1 Tax=Eumeta variegata TaxID=151549 RepID=A0A4C1SAF2_EUMVA|nr:hypothetical protein EVAR_25935_1 [Eumeta japonica]